jgi:O-antigen/teichoic acid export membrane protein
MADRISVKRNVAANYVGNMYGMLISFIMAPVYLSYMGTEAYGLIGFFTMLSSWFQLLDMGLTPTIVRETALFRGGQLSVGTLRVFLRGLEIIFGAVSVTAAAVLLFLTPMIATRWLKVGDLPIGDVEIAVGIMAAIVPIRWVSSLYRGVIVGFERMTWLAGYNIFISTLRFVGVLLVFFAFGVNVKYFFAYQFVVSAVELAGVMIISHRFLGSGEREKFSWAPLKSNATFSLAIGFVSTAWVLLTQTDKLVLSKALPLAMFGVFSLAVAAAAVINIVGGPIGQALLPRMTKLLAEGRDDDVNRLYDDATQTVSVIVFPGVAALIFLTEPILRAWTGHVEIARHAAPILQLYAIGNGISAYNAFAYYIQYA